MLELEKNKKLIVESSLLTGRQFEVVMKRLHNEPLTQVESNYLSKYIRPKLIAAELIAKSNLYQLIGDPRRRRFFLKEDLFVNGEEFILEDRIEKSKGILKELSSKYPGAKIIVYGGFLFREEYNDIDILVISSKYGDEKPVIEDELHIQFASSENEDLLLISSIEKVSVTNFKPKKAAYKPTFNDFIELNFLIDDLINNDFSLLILNKLRHLVILQDCIKNDKIPDSIEVEKKLIKILRDKYSLLKKRNYKQINPQSILKIIKPIIIDSLRALVKTNKEDLKTLKENINQFKDIKDNFHQFVYGMYKEALG